MTSIRYAQPADQPQIHDQHCTPAMLQRKIAANEVIVAQHGSPLIGWLRFGYFWDQMPFMNMLWVQAAYRNQGCGTQLVQWWETAMAQHGHTHVLTSTLSNETSQHFYRKRGYRDCGALLLPNEPLEIILIKEL